MTKKPNILFIMADQLRADYLGCNGHASIKTPVIDGLAASGVNFSRAYTNAPVCGAARMSFYTGRYVASHGASYNNVPLKISEKTIGDYLRPLGYRVALVGKTHMRADIEDMERLGINPNSSRGVLLSQCGFEAYERDDGLHPDQNVSPDLAYNNYLRAHGYEGDNPWHTAANSVAGEDGKPLSGWSMRNCNRPAIVKEEHSETAYTTDRAMDFIREASNDADEPWCLHLSYIKPHWPYIVPAPYHNMYGVDDIQAVNADEAELENPHPVVGAFMHHHESQVFSQPKMREGIIPAYMGLISQVDTHIGRVLKLLDELDIADNTVIVVTSDHGDYLGDHYLGEKELFHEESSRIPMIIYDPRTGADGSRGRVDNRLVEGIDLVPTFIDWAGGEIPDHIVEGASLAPCLLENSENLDNTWRQFAVSESDYAWRQARLDLHLPPDATRAVMLRGERYKYIYYQGFRPQLFDLLNDPNELHDLAKDPDDAHRELLQQMHNALCEWYVRRKRRTTVSNANVEKNTATEHQDGYLIGVW